MKLFSAFLLALLPTFGAFGQVQSPADMQSQMADADKLKSLRSTTSFATPLKTYLEFFAALTGGHSKTIASCQTEAFNLKQTDGRILTDDEFAALDARMLELKHTEFKLLSFVFTPHPTRPKIKFMYSYSRSAVTVNEEIQLTLVDTSSGWKIDAATTLQR